MTESKHWFK